MSRPPAIRSIFALFAAVFGATATVHAAPALEGRAFVQQSLPGVAGRSGTPVAVQLLQDERLTNEVREELARHDSIDAACAPAGDPASATLAAFCASLANARLQPAALTLVAADGTLLDSWSATGEPVATIAVENGVPGDRLFAITTSREGGVDVTRLFTVNEGAIRWIALGDPGAEAPLELVHDERPDSRALWRAGASRSGELEVLIARCEAGGAVTYSTIVRDGERWAAREREDGGCGPGRCFDCDGAFPPRSRFP